MSSLDSQVNLVVASLDLKLVQLLRQAIRTADLSGQAGGALTPETTIDPRRHLHPEPVIEPRRHFHAEPRVEPRPVFHLSPRLEPAPASRCIPCVPQCEPAITRSPIEPPWKVLAWKNPIPAPAKVKVVLYRPDIVHKGSLIDFFI